MILARTTENTATARKQLRKLDKRRATIVDFMDQLIASPEILATLAKH